MSRLTLRPGVRATGLETGLHVRGWAGSVSLSGGPAWWRLWRAVEPVLARGASAEWLAEQRGRPGVGPALDALLGALREHDLVVDLSESTVDLGSSLGQWLLTAAPDPVAAAGRLGVEPVRVTGAPGAPLGLAVAEVLADCGRAVVRQSVDSGLVDTVVLSMAVGSVALRVTGEFAAVTSVEPERAAVDQLRAAGTVLGGQTFEGDRGSTVLRGRTLEGDAGGSVLGGRRAGGRAATLAALTASTAVHRLLSAAAGLPDPAAPTAQRRSGPPGTRWIWVARPDPLRADYHPWWPPRPAGPYPSTDPRLATGSQPATGPEPAAGPEPVAGVGVVPAGWLDLLADPELGVVRTPHPDRLPQLPAALASCLWPSSHRDSPPWTVIGVAERAEDAHAEAVRRALELALHLPPDAALGRDRAEAVGIAWRRRADAVARSDRSVSDGRSGANPADLDPAEWHDHDRARRWWRALTERFGVPATVRVRRLGAAYHAEVRTDGELAPIRSWAVEPEPGDAVALALLRTTGAVQLTRAGLGRAGLDRPAPPPAISGVTGTTAAGPGPSVIAAESWPANLAGSMTVSVPLADPGRGPVDAGIAAAARATGWVIARWQP